MDFESSAIDTEEAGLVLVQGLAADIHFPRAAGSLCPGQCFSLEASLHVISGAASALLALKPSSHFL